MAIDKKLIQSVKEACHRLKAAGHDLGIEKLALGPVRRVVRQIRENVQDRRAARQGGRNQIQGQAAPTYPVAARRAAPTYPVAAPQAAASEPRMFDIAKSYANENESTVGSPRIGGGPANEVGPPDPNLFKTGPSINPGGLGSSLGGMLPASMQASLQNSLGNEGYARLLRAGGHAGIGAAIGLGGGALHGLLNPSDKKRRIRSMLMDALAGGAVGGLTGGVVGGVDPLADVASSALSSMGLGGS